MLPNIPPKKTRGKKANFFPGRGGAGANSTGGLGREKHPSPSLVASSHTSEKGGAKPPSSQHIGRKRKMVGNGKKGFPLFLLPLACLPTGRLAQALNYQSPLW